VLTRLLHRRFDNIARVDDAAIGAAQRDHRPFQKLVRSRSKVEARARMPLPPQRDELARFKSVIRMNDQSF